MCVSCRARLVAVNMHKANTKKETDKVKYWYFCPSCPSIRALGAKRKTPYCGDCNRVITGKKNKKEVEVVKKIKPPRVKHLRICPHCPEDNNTKQVNCNAKAGIRPCTKHRYADTKKAEPKPKKSYYVKKPKKDKTLKVSQEAIDRARRINEEHRLSLASEPKQVVIHSLKSDLELIEEWLKKNKPKQLDGDYDFTKTVNGQTNLSSGLKSDTIGGSFI